MSGRSGPAGAGADGARGRPRLRDYVAWHEAYDDPDSTLSVRLRRVQRTIGDAYDRMPGAVRVLSSCAGQGADILGVLEARPELRGRTTGALLELLEDNCAVARARIRDLGAELEVRRVDASVSDNYFGAVPADLVLLVGIMGNIPACDVERLVRASPQFCAPGATVIWTRGAQEPDLGPAIVRWFARAGFEHLTRPEPLEGTGMRVGVERLVGDPEPLRAGARLFTFFR